MGHGVNVMKWQLELLSHGSRRSTHIAPIIHERFCCNREDGNQNPMRYSLLPTIMQRVLDLTSAVVTHLDAVGTVSRQAGSLFGRSTDCFK